MIEETNTPELKPCPFCSGTHLHVKHGNAPSFSNKAFELEKWWITCRDCGTDGPYVNSAKLAIDTWNLREDYDALKAQRDDLLKAARALVNAEPNTRAWHEAMADLMMHCQGGAS